MLRRSLNQRTQVKHARTRPTASTHFAPLFGCFMNVIGIIHVNCRDIVLFISTKHVYCPEFVQGTAIPPTPAAPTPIPPNQTRIIRIRAMKHHQVCDHCGSDVLYCPLCAPKIADSRTTPSCLPLPSVTPLSPSRRRWC